MKPSGIILTAILAINIASLSAQKGIDDGSKFGHGTDSIRCIENISLFESYCKTDSYADALPAWEIVYAECPGSRIRIYSEGVKIIKWQISNEKNPAKKEALITKLLKLYDDRVKYYGDNASQPTPWIIGQKAIDYLALKGDKADQKLAYGWLKESIAGLTEKPNPQILYSFIQSAEAVYKLKIINKEQFINDYLEASSLIEVAINNSKGSMATYATQVQEFITATFVHSGAANCDDMQTLYAPKIEENKQDVEFLKTTIGLFRKLNCQESEAYFIASSYVHKVSPTPESAAGMAKYALKKDDFESASKYFDQAAELTTDNKDKAEYLYNNALIYTQRHNYPKARNYALKSAEVDPNNGEPYILIAKLYAGDANNIYPNDNILAQTVFYAAIDKLVKAKQVDPSVAAEADALIGSYRGYLPKSQDIFMHPDLADGKTIVIGGWIQEATRVR